MAEEKLGWNDPLGLTASYKEPDLTPYFEDDSSPTNNTSVIRDEELTR